MQVNRNLASEQEFILLAIGEESRYVTVISLVDNSLPRTSHELLTKIPKFCEW